MKVYIIQPPYSTEYERGDEYFGYELDLLDKCDPSADIIVLPEYCDCPSMAKTKEENDASVAAFNSRLLTKASETAKRCNAIVFANASLATENGYRNTTYAFDRNGETKGKYFKQHLVKREEAVMKLDSEYTYEFSEPTVIEIDGIRFGFLTCYDFYFYEAYSSLARQSLDMIIGCSHQRSDTHEATEIIARFLAYNTNAYVVRASVSMDESSDVGGGSMVVAPDGKVLANMRSRIGIETVDIDIDRKHYKPAGFGNKPAPHWQYIESGRRPWKYRPAGPAIIRRDEILPYPRACARGGFGGALQRNTLPSFGAAVAAGADEIELALRFANDGAWKAELESVLQKLACHAIMNINIDEDACNYTDEALAELSRIVRKYDCEKHIYITTSSSEMQRKISGNAPDLCRCMSEGEGSAAELADKAIRCGCKKLQLSAASINREIISTAHENKIALNAVCDGDETEMRRLLDMGVDTLVVSECDGAIQLVKEYKSRNK